MCILGLSPWAGGVVDDSLHPESKEKLVEEPLRAGWCWESSAPVGKAAPHGAVQTSLVLLSRQVLQQGLVLYLLRHGARTPPVNLLTEAIAVVMKNASSCSLLHWAGLFSRCPTAYAPLPVFALVLLLTANISASDLVLEL